jgi:hypothetical protein
MSVEPRQLKHRSFELGAVVLAVVVSIGLGSSCAVAPGPAPADAAAARFDASSSDGGGLAPFDGWPSSPDAPDAAEADGWVLVGPRVELGEGAGSFRPIADDDVLLLARGCQGSQHVWIALRAYELVALGMIVDLELVRARDDVRISSDYLVRVSFIEQPDGFSELIGIALQVPEPGGEIGTDLVLRASLEDTAHEIATAERRVRIEWGPELCAD